MALVLNGTDVYARVTGLTTNWNYVGATVLFWVKRSATNSTTTSTALSLSDSGGSVYTDVKVNGGSTWVCESAGNPVDVTTYADDVWICLGYGIENSTGNRFSFYGNGSGMTRDSESLGIFRGATNLARFTIGQNMSDSALTQLSGKIAHIRHYNALLSAAEALTEAQNSTPQAASCIYAWPLTSDGAATVGSGTFTVTATSGTGTYDDGADDPIGGGTSVAPLAMGAFMRMRNG